MESMQELAKSALTSIASVQLIAVALGAGLLMKKYEQMVYVTLAALGIDQLVTVMRALVNKAPLVKTVNTKWHGFLGLEMQTFLTAFIGFAIVISLAFALKSLVKKHT